MAKDVITAHCKDFSVREDSYKDFRFVHLGVITAAMYLAVIALLFLMFFW